MRERAPRRALALWSENRNRRRWRVSPLVAWVDSSTQSYKAVIWDAQTGALVRSGQAPHPPGTQVDPGGLATDAGHRAGRRRGGVSRWTAAPPRSESGLIGRSPGSTRCRGPYGATPIIAGPDAGVP